MTELVMRVTRRIYPKTDMGLVETQYGSTKLTMWLSDVVRHQMAGERMAFFESKMDGGKVTLGKRVADPRWV